ncbi:MAG: ABC transporter substrate-binding protein [Actinomycetota bacterium]
MKKKTTRRAAALSAALGLSLVVTACGDGESGSDSSATSAGGDCAAYQQYGDLKGKKVTVYANVIAPGDKELTDSFKPFQDCTGAEIVYEGSKEFESQLKVRVKSGNVPDIALIPQPGFVADLARDGKLKKAPAATEKNVDELFGPDWKAYGVVDGTFYAAPLDAAVKSLVWFSPQAFADKGYEVPTTWAKMIELSNKIVADNPDGKTKPWCDGIASGDATGWKVTDWVEDLVLREAGPEVYDQWVKHEIPFNDARIVQAMDAAGAILKNEKYVNGGVGDVKSIATTEIGDAGLPVVNGGCYMHRQASFYANNFPEGTKVAADGDVWAFQLPATDPAKGLPVVTAGQFTAAFTDRPEVQAFQTFLSSAEWANYKAQVTPIGASASANRGLKIENLKSPVDKLSVEILQKPEVVARYDGSDLMPSAVGAGSFWKESTAWITGKSTKDALDAVEKSWPKS